MMYDDFAAGLMMTTTIDDYYYHYCYVHCCYHDVDGDYKRNDDYYGYFW